MEEVRHGLDQQLVMLTVNTDDVDPEGAEAVYCDNKVRDNDMNGSHITKATLLLTILLFSHKKTLLRQLAKTGF